MTMTSPRQPLGGPNPTRLIQLQPSMVGAKYQEITRTFLTSLTLSKEIVVHPRCQNHLHDNSKTSLSRIHKAGPKSTIVAVIRPEFQGLISLLQRDPRLQFLQ